MADYIVHKKVCEPDTDGIRDFPDYPPFFATPLIFVGKAVKAGYLFCRKRSYTPAVIFYEDGGIVFCAMSRDIGTILSVSGSMTTEGHPFVRLFIRFTAWEEVPF